MAVPRRVPARRTAPGKPKCAIHFEGIDGTGNRQKPKALVDPASGSGIRDWNRAVEVIRDKELPAPPDQIEKPQTNLADAIASFLAFKARRSPDVQRKTRLILCRMRAFLEGRKKVAVEEITFTDLVDFRARWTDAMTTQLRNQGRGSSGSASSPISSPAILPRISTLHPKGVRKLIVTREEMERIFASLGKLTDEYGRSGQPIAAQTKAFILVMRYTGMSIGDTAKLEKADVQGNRIRTPRKKTGEDVFGKVPPFVTDALNAAPHDSEQHYVWTGQGLLHTRASKWGTRLQRLFVLADVRTVEATGKLRSGGKLKADAETAKISKATPQMFRHTLARDLLARGTPMEEIAELPGNSMKVVEKYYSKWDV